MSYSSSGKRLRQAPRSVLFYYFCDFCDALRSNEGSRALRPRYRQMNNPIQTSSVVCFVHTLCWSCRPFGSTRDRSFFAFPSALSQPIKYFVLSHHPTPHSGSFPHSPALLTRQLVPHFVRHSEGEVAVLVEKFILRHCRYVLFDLFSSVTSHHGYVVFSRNFLVRNYNYPPAVKRNLRLCCRSAPFAELLCI